MLTVNELFAGIGAFRKALINLGIEHKVVGISEIDKYAIRSYEALYGQTRNYGDITKVETLDYADLWTYGFPCQDISLAGQQAGIVKGVTRSGLLYEVERLLWKAKEDATLPKYLIMENVKNLISKKFKIDFLLWLQTLEDIGFESSWAVLDAKDYGIPQHRERTFAVSIRKDIPNSFKFPAPVPLATSFRDLLEQDVNDKYWLTDGYVKSLLDRNEEQINKGNGFLFEPVERENADVAKTLTSGLWKLRPVDNYIQMPVNPEPDGTCRTSKAQYWKRATRIL